MGCCFFRERPIEAEVKVIGSHRYLGGGIVDVAEAGNLAPMPAFLPLMDPRLPPASLSRWPLVDIPPGFPSQRFIPYAGDGIDRSPSIRSFHSVAEAGGYGAVPDQDPPPSVSLSPSEFGLSGPKRAPGP